MSTGNDIPVAGGGYKDVGTRGSILHSGDFIASHRGLEGIDGVDLGNENTSTVGAERLGALETE